jgi:hypothetical protein
MEKILKFVKYKNNLMKRILLLITILSITCHGLLQAQGFGFAQRATVEERVKRVTEKLDSAFKLDAARLSMVDTALKVLYRAQDAKRQEIMSSDTRPDRETMMAEMKKFSDVQDEIIGSVLSKEELGIWKEKIQPSMRPRGMGGPGGGQFRERNNQ